MLHGKWGFHRKRKIGKEEEKEVEQGENSRQITWGKMQSEGTVHGTGRRGKTRLRMSKGDQTNELLQGHIT